MDIVLSQFGRTFASRARAREVLLAMPQVRYAPQVRLVLDDVIVTPSFVAELLAELSAQASQITTIGGSDEARRMVTRLIGKLLANTSTGRVPAGSP